MGAGAICLGLTFAKLAKLAPATGGPYAYTRMAYGDFAGFLMAWALWISMWSSLPVIAHRLRGRGDGPVSFDAQSPYGGGAHAEPLSGPWFS